MGKYIMQEQLGQAAILTYANPPANTWMLDAVVELGGIVAELGDRSACRALVLTGAGDAFFSGGCDAGALIKGGHAYAERWLAAWGETFAAFDRFSGVTVAALNGHAFGVGLGCALACDYVVVEREARLGIAEAREGLVPLGGTSKRLVDKVGLAWAKRLLLGGEEIDAERALAIGLVEELVDPGFAKIVGLSLASKVARQGEHAVAATRHLLSDAPGASLASQAARENEIYLRLLAGDEAREGLAAMSEGRLPAWFADGD